MDVRLDEHDVNAFQVYINEDPYLLCTVMTHTRHSTTKVKLQIPSTTTVWTAKLSGRFLSTLAGSSLILADSGHRIVDRGVLSHISNMNFQFWAVWGSWGCRDGFFYKSP